MEHIILAIGTGMIGASLGYLFGVMTRRFLTPTVKQLSQAIEEERTWSKTMQGRLKARIKEYEQPTELMQMANTPTDNSQDMVNMLVNTLGSIRGLPRWVRPFLPAITSWIQENPEKVQALIAKFLTPHKGEQGLSSSDAL